MRRSLGVRSARRTSYKKEGSQIRAEPSREMLSEADFIEERDGDTTRRRRLPVERIGYDLSRLEGMLCL